MSISGSNKAVRGTGLTMLSKLAIEEFRIIYQNQYGEELSFAEATKQANSLIRLYKAVLSPLKNNTSQNEEVDLRNTA
jgi:hypothetical protein